MGEVHCKVVNESNEAAPPCQSHSRAARKRRMEIRRTKFFGGSSVSTHEPEIDNGLINKRPKLVLYSAPPIVSRSCDNAVDYSGTDDEQQHRAPPVENSPIVQSSLIAYPKFGVASVCGRRRDMEDAVAVHPCFYQKIDYDNREELHYFAVYDGHGCSHVAMKCKERLHELVKEELENDSKWEHVMDRSFNRMDKEAIDRTECVLPATCRCELQMPELDAVGSTAVVSIVTPDKIIVANCGDSRAVLCRNGKAVPLSTDHKPDRPDELKRIQEAGGRVIYWDGARVLGVLAMSRAIGDSYLKPYVICEPEVTITDRTANDDCLILASDGLWDVVSNDTACALARQCLRGKAQTSSVTSSSENDIGREREKSDKDCNDASMLLTKLALARRSADNVSVVVVDLRKDT